MKSAPAMPEHQGIEISDRDRASLGPELHDFVANLPDTPVAAQYRALVTAFDSGRVEGELLDRFGAFLELGLSTGRFRARMGLNGEDVIRRLFARTPRGRALNASAEEVTEALQRLVGQSIRELSVSVVRPGTYRLVLESDQYRVSLGLAPAGAHVESVEVSL